MKNKAFLWVHPTLKFERQETTYLGCLWGEKGIHCKNSIPSHAVIHRWTQLKEIFNYVMAPKIYSYWSSY